MLRSTVLTHSGAQSQAVWDPLASGCVAAYMPHKYNMHKAAFRSRQAGVDTPNQQPG
jgi:hypothetical protein